MMHRTISLLNDFDWLLGLRCLLIPFPREISQNTAYKMLKLIAVMACSRLINVMISSIQSEVINLFNADVFDLKHHKTYM